MIPWIALKFIDGNADLEKSEMNAAEQGGTEGKRQHRVPAK